MILASGIILRARLYEPDNNYTIEIEFLNAPAGYEDEEGFHYENQKEKAVVKNIEEKNHESVFILTS